MKKQNPDKKAQGEVVGESQNTEWCKMRSKHIWGHLFIFSNFLFFFLFTRLLSFRPEYLNTVQWYVLSSKTWLKIYLFTTVKEKKRKMAWSTSRTAVAFWNSTSEAWATRFSRTEKLSFVLHLFVFAVAEAFNPVRETSLLPATAMYQEGHRSLLNVSESFCGKLQLWPSDTSTRATTASLRREPSIKLPLCLDLYFFHMCVSERQYVFGGWEEGGGWRLGSYLPWPQADCSPRAPGVSVRERWIRLSPLANLSPGIPEPSHHPHLLSHLSQNILLDGVHRPLCPSSPLLPHQQGAIWGEERCDYATNLSLSCSALPMSLSASALQGRLPPRSRWRIV